MGHLDFEVLEVSGFAADTAVVLGWWELTQPVQGGDGLYTLIMKKVAINTTEELGWKIVHEHTSSRLSPVEPASKMTDHKTANEHAVASLTSR